MVAFLLIGGIGFFMLVLTWFLGELFDLGHGFAEMVGEHVPDVAVGGHHLEIGHHEAAAEHGPSPLSSRVIFTFMTAFGGAGAIASSYGLSTIASVGVAFAGGLALGAVFYVFNIVVFRQQGSSGFSIGSLVGHTGRVVVSIPRGGTGQVSVGAAGGTSTLLARAQDGSAVPQDQMVRVVQVEGDLLLVQLEASTVVEKPS